MELRDGLYALRDGAVALVTRIDHGHILTVVERGVYPNKRVELHRASTPELDRLQRVLAVATWL